jgi:hypothetical protein
LNKIKFITSARSEIVLVFLFCIVVYNANGVTISSSDTVTNTLLASNLLESYTLHLDVFRNSYFIKRGIFYAFLEGNNGHLTTAYPIGPGIVTFPLYIVFYTYLKLTSIQFDIASESFEIYRVFLRS